MTEAHNSWKLRKQMIFREILTFAHIFRCRKLYEFFRRKPGWRFTAGLELGSQSEVLKYVWSFVFDKLNFSLGTMVCSRRNEQSRNYSTLTPNMMKHDKHWKLSIFFKSIENINVSFSASNNIDFWSRQIHMAEKWWSNLKNLICPKCQRWQTIKNM